MHKALVVMLVAAVVGLTGCRSKPPAPEPTPTSSSSSTSSTGANSGSVEGEDIETPGPQEGLLARRTIYFDFDSSEIKGEGTDIVAAHAKNLGTSKLRVRLEGHTDERGSREYNIGLGERRAQAVRRALLLQGATDAQLSTVSYGEERPAAAGSNEAAWQQNRRVELVYIQ